MKKPCRLDGSAQLLKTLHHASQPRAGAHVSMASNPRIWAWAGPPSSLRVGTSTVVCIRDWKITTTVTGIQ